MLVSARKESAGTGYGEIINKTKIALNRNVNYPSSDARSVIAGGRILVVSKGGSNRSFALPLLLAATQCEGEVSCQARKHKLARALKITPLKRSKQCRRQAHLFISAPWRRRVASGHNNNAGVYMPGGFVSAERK